MDNEQFIKQAIEKAIDENPDYMFIDTDVTVVIDRGTVYVKET